MMIRVLDKSKLILKAISSIIILCLIFLPEARAIAPEQGSKNPDARENIAENLLEESNVIPFSWAREHGMIPDHDPLLAVQIARTILERNPQTRAGRLEKLSKSTLPKFAESNQISGEDTRNILDVVKVINPESTEDLDTALRRLENLRQQNAAEVPEKKAASLGTPEDAYRDRGEQRKRLLTLITVFTDLKENLDRAFYDKKLLKNTSGKEMTFQALKNQLTHWTSNVYADRNKAPFSSFQNFDFEKFKIAVDQLKEKDKTSIARVTGFIDPFLAQSKKLRQKLFFQRFRNPLAAIRSIGSSIREINVRQALSPRRMFQSVAYRMGPSQKWRFRFKIGLTIPVILFAISMINSRMEKRYEAEREKERIVQLKKAELSDNQRQVREYLRAIRDRYGLPMISEEAREDLVKKVVEEGRIELLKEFEGSAILKGYFDGTISTDLMFTRNAEAKPVPSILISGNNASPSGVPLVEGIRRVPTNFSLSSPTGTGPTLSVPGGHIAYTLEGYYYVARRYPNIPNRLSSGELYDVLKQIQDKKIELGNVYDYFMKRAGGGKSLGEAEKPNLTPRDLLLNTAIAAVELVEQAKALSPILERQEALYEKALANHQAKSDAEKAEIAEAIRWAISENEVLQLEPQVPVHDIVAQKALIETTSPSEINNEEVENTIALLGTLDKNLILFILSEDGPLDNLLGNNYPLSPEVKSELSRILESKNLRQVDGNFAEKANAILYQLKREAAVVSDSKELLTQSVYNTDVMALFDVKRFVEMGDTPSLVLNVLGRLAKTKDKQSYLLKLQDYGMKREGLIILIDLDALVEEVVTKYRAHLAAAVKA